MVVALASVMVPSFCFSFVLFVIVLKTAQPPTVLQVILETGNDRRLRQLFVPKMSL